MKMYTLAGTLQKQKGSRCQTKRLQQLGELIRFIKVNYSTFPLFSGAVVSMVFINGQYYYGINDTNSNY